MFNILKNIQKLSKSLPSVVVCNSDLYLCAQIYKLVHKKIIAELYQLIIVHTDIVYNSGGFTIACLKTNVLVWGFLLPLQSGRWLDVHFSYRKCFSHIFQLILILILIIA